ncbi:ribosomal-protein-alanine N-acetyltransferase [Pseudidiomarina sediminum]|uniref:[Ribosomal protein bS18]-alanine N-acetyltransferase n=1 Tax=Pseudidiomarina sediminum TaxID=431675 RepID=A0A432YZM1_9GAMM|nr:ribosomal protein S18-alanine N-acetyltransferase [Pseudidiomarina sediminum]MBY6065102.1 ribosomal protein S18-alanine N-acetyltransferase [Pseudidiomarina sediminum]RUO69374.1 ribosomal-protein-alanine N-acetyltransferase [Pseudidiomarina sediminum]
MLSVVDTYSDALFAIETASHAFPWSETTLRNCLQQAGYQVVGYYQQHELQGFYVASQVCDEITLMDIAVHPSFQGQGIGRQLLAHLLAQATQSKATVFLEVRVSNTAAIKLYVKLGFQQVGRRPNYYPCGDKREDALVMVWRDDTSPS